MSESGWILGALLLGSPGREHPEAAAVSVGGSGTVGHCILGCGELLQSCGPRQMEAEASGEAVPAAWVTRNEAQDLGDRWVDRVVETDTRDRTVRLFCPPFIVAWAWLL